MQESKGETRSETSSEAGNEPRTEQVTYVTQSKFFTPAFNAAIFDGPIRIYFAQHQESQALKLYFNLQERYGDVRRNAREAFKEKGCNIFVMLYPNEETFDDSFGDDEGSNTSSVSEKGLGLGAGAEAGPLSAVIATDRLGTDYVLGVRGPLEDEIFETLCLEMDEIVRSPGGVIP